MDDTDEAAASILAAVRERDRARAVAARLVDAAESRLRTLVAEYTGSGTITAARAASLIGMAATAGPEITQWGPARRDEPCEEREDGFGGLQPVDRLLALFATRLPTRDELRPTG